MFKTNLKILFIFLWNFIPIFSCNQLSQLSSSLNQLKNVRENLNKYYFSEVFYQDLYNTLLKVTQSQNFALFDKYFDLKSLLILIFKNEYSIHPTSEFISTIIQSLIRTYHKIIQTYKPDTELHITSLGGEYLLHERLLLHALVKKGYNNIHFYSIDPHSAKSLERFDKENELSNIVYKHFKTSQDYITEIIKKEGKIPHVCITINPPFWGGNNFNCFMIKDEQEILIIPEAVNEKSILINEKNQNNIAELNTRLALSKFKESPKIWQDPTNRFNIILQFEPKITIFNLLSKEGHVGQYGLKMFNESLIIDFLELIKLASSPNQECIAWNCTWYGMNNDKIEQRELRSINYNKIADKSIALLFKQTLQYSNDWKIYAYDAHTNQFEIEA